jgi:hypothetical protein
MLYPGLIQWPERGVIAGAAIFVPEYLQFKTPCKNGDGNPPIFKALGVLFMLDATVEIMLKST